MISYVVYVGVPLAVSALQEYSGTSMGISLAVFTCFKESRSF